MKLYAIAATFLLLLGAGAYVSHSASAVLAHAHASDDLELIASNR